MNADRVLAALLSSPAGALVGATPQGDITLWSAGAEQLYGWTAGEALGKHLSLLVPEERQHELDRHTQAQHGDEVPPFETVRVASDGTRIDVELHVLAVRDASGELEGLIALHRDLRRVHRAELALSATQEELQARFARSPVPQARVDLTGRILAVNPALEELLGVPAEQLVGNDALGLYVEEDRAEVQAALAELAAGGVSYLQHERTLRRGNGTTARAVVTVTVVREADGRLILAAAAEDVTALRAAQEEAQEEAARLDVLVQTMPVVVFSYDLAGRCTSSRGQALAHLGLKDGELVGRSLLEMYADVPVALAALRGALRGEGSTVRLELAERSWETHFRPLRDVTGDVAGGLGVALDMTERAAAEREVAANEARLRSLLQHASEVALVLEPGGRIVYASAAVRDQLGYDEATLFWRTSLEFNHPDDHAQVLSAWHSVLSEPGAVVRLECRVRHADGTWRWADHVLTNLLGDPAVGGVVVNVRESTERRRAEAELRRLAVRDPLTGLANRTLLLDRTDQALVAARRSGTAVGVVLLDVVGMRGHNEQLGQQGGNDLLRAVAGRLERAVRPTDTVARIAGDEFAVLIGDVASEEDLRARATLLLDVVGEPVEIGSRAVQVALEVGTSLSPAPDAGALLAAAERARAGSGAAAVAVGHSLGLEGDVAGSQALTADALRRAIHGGELVLYYQPILHLATEQAAGVEALVRWAHPERGLLAPGEFIPLAESSGLIVDLGAWVLQTACAQLASWRRQGRPLAVGINLSPRQLVGAHFAELVRDVLAGTGVPPGQIVLEVTESAVMDDPGAPAALAELHAMGLHLALDDFGTGYSSLTYLKRFPVDAIKIDRSFVAGLGRDPDDEAIVASVVSLARAVGKTVVAEGVETPVQREALQALGVDQAQGYLWSPAVSAAQLEAWLEASRARQPVARRLAVTAPVPAAVSSGSDGARILALQGQGASLHTIAAALNAEGRRTPAGSRWTATAVARVVVALLPPAGGGPR